MIAYHTPIHVRVALVGWLFSALLLIMLGLASIVHSYDLARFLQ